MAQPDDRCQIYLCVPGDIDPSQLDAFLADDGLDHVACVMLRAGPSGEINTALGEKLSGAAHGRELALVVENDVAAAVRLGADGVHTGADEDAYDAARGKLGDDAIVGAGCGLSRHAALTMAERGADYVAFAGDQAELRELVEWWAEVTVVPCVAWDVPDIETAMLMAEAGANFIAVEPFGWGHADGPAAALRQLSERLAAVKAAA